MIDELDFEIIELLQQRFLNGSSPCEVVKLFESRVPRNHNGALIASEYLQEAFQGSIFETKVIGAWDYFEGGTWSAEQIGDSLAEMCEDWKIRRRFIVEE